jgi:aminoglycoside 2'-N-acetyltransferase I
VTELRTVHTADLDAGARSAIRSLMDAAFGTVSDDTFDNVLGGAHLRLAAGIAVVTGAGGFACR